MIAKVFATELVVLFAIVFVGAIFREELPRWLDDALGWAIIIDIAAGIATAIWGIWK